jgi:hypothetical protein
MNCMAQAENTQGKQDGLRSALPDLIKQLEQAWPYYDEASESAASDSNDLALAAYDRISALEGLIATVEASNLYEAAIQLMLVNAHLQCFMEPEAPDGVGKIHREMGRLLLSALSVVESAAGIGPEHSLRSAYASVKHSPFPNIASLI